MYVPEPGHVIWAWIRPPLEEGAGGRAARIRIRAVDTDPARGDRLRLVGAELDPELPADREISFLVEPDRLWRVSPEGADRWTNQCSARSASTAKLSAAGSADRDHL